MTVQLDLLMEKLQSVDAEIEAELTKRREELRFHLECRGSCSKGRCCKTTARS